MNYKQLHDYIRDVSTGLDFDVTFFHGLPESFDQIPRVKGVAVLLFPMTSNGVLQSGTQSVNESYSVSLTVYMQDRSDSGINANRTDTNQTQDETKILEQTSKIADQILRNLNANDITPALRSNSDLLEITSFDKSQAIKETQHKFTGTTLNMSISVSDKFDYCC